MNILIPVDNDDFEDSSISLIDEAKYWLFVEFEEGKILKANFYQARDEIEEWMDVVIVKNNNEYVWPFMEENMAVLVAPLQRSVEDVMEAFLFKELHDFNELGTNKK